MKASCSDCGKTLTRGFYIAYRDKDRFEAGKGIELTEVIGCPNCGHIAIAWFGSDELVFYTESSQKRT